MSISSSKKWVSFQRFAELSGVKRNSITYAATHGLKEAVKDIPWKENRKRRVININHESSIFYLQNQERKLRELQENYSDIGLISSKNQKETTDNDVNNENQPSEIDIQKISHMTLGEILNHFGTFERFRRYVEVSKLLAETLIKQTTYLEKRGSLISRQLVANKIFGTLDSLNKRLLTEARKTITLRLYNAIKSGQTIEECDEIVEKIISQQLKHITSTAKSTLKNKE